MAESPLFVAQRRVLMADTDAAGVIYYGRVYRWLEALVSGWLASIGHPARSIFRDGSAYPCVHSEADYLHALTVDDVLDMRLDRAHVGRTSFGLVAEGRLGPVRAVSIRGSYVWARTGDLERSGFAPTPLPDWLRAALG